MSLTSMLRGKTENDQKLQTILREIIPKRNEFSTISGNEAFSSKTTILAPYQLQNSYHSSVVGTSFDYLARFIVSHHTQKDATLYLSAEHGLEIVQRYSDHSTAKRLSSTYKKGIALINKTVKREELDVKKLLPVSAFLARLEHVYRSGMPPMDIKKSLLDKEDHEIIIDLERLCEIFIEKFITPEIITKESTVVFNPHFGIMSQSCGGADADIYIDGTLYDFKTSKAPGYRWQDIAQLFGYYILNNLANHINDQSATLHSYELNRVAFYKARYGEIEYIDLSSISPEKIEYATMEINKLLEPQLNLIKSKHALLSETTSRVKQNTHNNEQIQNNIPMAYVYLLMIFLVLFIFFWLNV